MQTEAKHQISCDSCKKAIVVKTGKTKGEEKKNEPQPVEAIFNEGTGNEKNYQFCDEECLRVFLNTRRKKAKASIELDIVNNLTRKFIQEV